MSEKMRFTDRAIDRIQPRAERFIVWAEGHRGLGVRVTPRGEKTYVYSYRFAGRPRLLTIGTARGLSVDEAIVAHAEAVRSVAKAEIARSNGETPPAELDPGVKKARAREAMRTAETVADVWKAYLAKRRPGWRDTTARENERMWATYLEPHFGRKLARDVQPRDVKALLDEIAERGPIMSNRVRALLAAIYHFAVDSFIVPASPVQSVRRVSKEVARDRALIDESELRGFLRAIRDPGWPAAERRGLLWTLATGCRPGESMAMTWEQVDEAAATWTIPAEIAKTGLPHVVPLSSFAVAILADCKAAGAVSGHPIAYAPGTEQLDADALSRSLREGMSMLAAHDVAPLRPHDLRRTCRTWLSKLGISRDLAERCIGHVEKDPIVRTYDRHQWLPEKRVAFETWGATLEAMSK